MDKMHVQGRVFGRLTAVEYVGRNEKGLALWRCACACGGEVVRRAWYLRSRPQAQSCGCISKERLAAQGTHGQCPRSGPTPTWYSWRSMHYRCTAQHKHRRYYFDKGITVCPTWSDFNQFVADMGERPTGTTLDRRDNAEGYTKDNCRWATRSEQQLNKTTTKRYSHAGERLTLTEWAKHSICVVSYNTLHRRVSRYGWAVGKSITQPPIKRTTKP